MAQPWLKMYCVIRKVGGAVFVDRRFGNLFVRHNTVSLRRNGESS